MRNLSVEMEYQSNTALQVLLKQLQQQTFILSCKEVTVCMIFFVLVNVRQEASYDKTLTVNDYVDGPHTVKWTDATFQVLENLSNKYVSMFSKEIQHEII